AVSGDVEITARVTQIMNNAGSSFSRTGVMIREELTEGAKHAMMTLKPNGELEFFYRPATDGQSTSVKANAAFAPYWVRVVRSGNVFTGYTSADGVTWRQEGSTSFAMASTVYVGLAVS